MVLDHDAHRLVITARAQHDRGVPIVRPAVLDRVLQQRLQQKDWHTRGLSSLPRLRRGQRRSLRQYRVGCTAAGCWMGVV